MKAPAFNDTGLTPVRVWDLPTRLFHWALVACFIGSVVSAKIGPCHRTASTSISEIGFATTAMLCLTAPR